jgi:hypothetical protein
MKTKTKGLESGMITLAFSGLLFYFLGVSLEQTIFWSLFLSLSAFSVNYTIKVQKDKAFTFCVYAFYVGAICFILGLIGLSQGWGLALSLLIVSILVILGNFITHSILTAPLMPDEDGLV